MAPSTRSNKRRSTSSVSPAPSQEEPAVTTPVSGRKLTKQEAREEAKLRAAIAMGHADYHGTPSKKKATTPKVKFEEPKTSTDGTPKPKRTPSKPTPTKVNNPYFSPPSQNIKPAPAITEKPNNPADSDSESVPNEKENHPRIISSNKKRDKEASEETVPMPPTKKQLKPTAEAIPNLASLLGSMSIGDTATPEYDPVPKVLMEKLLQSTNAKDTLSALIELWNELEMAIPKASSKKVVHEDVLDKAICSGTTPCIVISVAQKWKNNEEIQRRSLDCLCRLSEATPCARASIVKFGGVETIVNAMERFQATSTNMLNTGCGCLLKLSVDCYNPASIDNGKYKLIRVWHRFLHDMGGIQLLVKTMERNQDFKALQSNCIKIFYNLAVVKETRSIMEAAGVVESVAAARKKHATDNVIMDASERFMKRMFSK